ncbi:hypothetical protein B0T11DRAFT_79784 [Plectosphaerella cucumerina]|uniref:Uncharacterized protein n=1 Tax=Plectosphaerella cucumerina TaxID=40658 RepID=A0A8K0TGG9_9PEZI|nr:hypothetical protein B0T11DRAFT_79784 [Plectosphaerella cucumerina]
MPRRRRVEQVCREGLQSFQMVFGCFKSQSGRPIYLIGRRSLREQIGGRKGDWGGRIVSRNDPRLASKALLRYRTKSEGQRDVSERVQNAIDDAVLQGDGGNRRVVRRGGGRFWVAVVSRVPARIRCLSKLCRAGPSDDEGVATKSSQKEHRH